jgi:hypothetical protein
MSEYYCMATNKTDLLDAIRLLETLARPIDTSTVRGMYAYQTLNGAIRHLMARKGA